MIEKTLYGVPVISEELMGKNDIIENDRYTDAYLEQINELYHLDNILGSRKSGIANGEWADLDYFTRSSPLRNSEGEDILNAILYHSANAGLWQPKIIDVDKLTDPRIKTAEEYLEQVKTISPDYGRGMISKGNIYGISVAKKGGFVELNSLDNKVIVLPTQSFVEYCISRNE
ncbi:MAG: hypothetical protein KAT28_00800 [Candidatus Aenigmarchaeota archaeon]|nr:hypothetical protein [Candidatus Aenigmarchaeota archaeon]